MSCACLDVDDGLPAGWRDRAAHWATRKQRIHELHLFGSRATGSFGPGSDVDLAYVLTGTSPGETLAYSIYEAGEWEQELHELLDIPVQLHMADSDTDAIVWSAVIEHGQLIYRKEGYLPVS